MTKRKKDQPTPVPTPDEAGPGLIDPKDFPENPSPEAVPLSDQAPSETEITGPTKRPKQESIPSLVTGRHPELRHDEGKPFVGVSTAHYPCTHVGGRNPAMVKVTKGPSDEPDPLTRDTPIEVDPQEMFASPYGQALDALMALKDLYPAAEPTKPQEPAPAPVPTTSEPEGGAPVLCLVIPSGASVSISTKGGITVTAGRNPA